MCTLSSVEFMGFHDVNIIDNDGAAVKTDGPVPMDPSWRIHNIFTNIFTSEEEL